MAEGRKRGSWKVPLAGFVGFALGSATVLLIVWLYGEGATPTAGPQPAVSAPAAAPALSPPMANPPVLALPSPTPPADLARRDLLMPVQGVRREDLRDTFNEARSQGRVHEAIDIMAPRNSLVRAVEDGRIVKLFTSNLGGLTIYQFDPTETYCYYYAHLESYAPGLKEGDRVVRGQVVGYVGTTGNAGPNSPHLHFAIFQLNADKHWWQGQAINPYPILRQGRPS